jgi:hypothetical protein
MRNREVFKRVVPATMIFSAAMLGAASESLFRPEWPAIATAGIVALVLVGLLAPRSEV